jgi:ParB-like chromosome segregation protein Spo0J
MNNIIESLQSLAVPLSDITPDPRNARAHSDKNIAVIKRSLEFYGQRKPIVVNRNGNAVIAGNGVYLAARELGWTEIAAAFTDDDEVTATAYGIIDNKSSDLSEFDMPGLKDLLQDLDTGAFDMEMTGFDETELAQLFTQYHPDEAEKEETKTNKCPQCGYEW